jgi:hypothetical protein
MSSLSPPAASRGVLAPFAALVATAVAMGVSLIFVRLANVGPFSSAFWRVVLAAKAVDYPEMVAPPSTTRTCPVMNEEAFEAR